MMMKGTPREGRGAEEGRGGRRKEAVTSVNNIRESSYKIARSRSNRTDHSLSTKKPLALHSHPHTLSKPRLQTHKDTPNTPAHTQSLQEKYVKTADTRYETAPANKYTPSKPISHGEMEESAVKKESGAEGAGKSCEFDCLQAIWENTKTLKASGFFPSEILELESILQRMVFKLAQQENCLSADRQHSAPHKRHQLKATCDTEDAISGRIQHLFQDHKLSCGMRDGRQSIKSSYGSLRIQNEDSHKLEYLEIYQGTDMLRDITNSCRVSSQQSHLNYLSLSNEKGSSVRREEKPQWEDRVYLRSIVKRTKPNEARPKASNGDCCEKSEGVGGLNLSYECELLSCEGRKEAVSSSSSESKREVLNQIISMLNRKYQRTLKGDPGRVFI